METWDECGVEKRQHRHSNVSRWVSRPVVLRGCGNLVQQFEDGEDRPGGIEDRQKGERGGTAQVDQDRATGIDVGANDK